MVQDVLAHQFEIYVSVFFHSALRCGTASGSDRMAALPQKTNFVFKTKAEIQFNPAAGIRSLPLAVQQIMGHNSAMTR
jgi:hypothetical protein